MTKVVNAFVGQHRFLSNFYLSPLVYVTTIYPTSEHAYQAAKTLDPEWRDKITSASSPSEAKRLGKRAPMREDWHRIKLDVMHDIVLAKFEQNAEIADKLMDLEGYELIEGNYWNDTFWGVCRGRGENHLGKILMKTRDRLIKTRDRLIKTATDKGV
jgi:ribA/ribD-fused uncharacterized protein